jgi:hypothetical protein
MPVTQPDLDALKVQVDGLNQMIADGVRQATIGDQTLTYNTTDSLIRARNDAQTRLEAAQASFDGQRRGRVTLLSYAGRGYQ